LQPFKSGSTKSDGRPVDGKRNRDNSAGIFLKDLKPTILSAEQLTKIQKLEKELSLSGGRRRLNALPRF